MYAHQVIESIKSFIDISHDKKLNDKLQGDIIRIRSSHHFHMPEKSILEEILNKFDGFTFQSSSVRAYLHLPYDCCWFDFRDKSWSVLVHSWSKSIWMIQHYMHDPRTGEWVFAPLTTWWSTQGHFKDDENGKQFIEQLKAPNKDVAWQSWTINTPWSIYSDIGEPESWEIALDSMSSISASLMLLHAKNVETQQVRPDRKLNKRRISKNKQPLFIYKVLKVKGQNTKGNKQTDGKGFYRLHFCRGHFKRYTVDAPLFGKLTGLYWWDAQIRGNKKRGIVIKDYEVSHGSKGKA